MATDNKYDNKYDEQLRLWGSRGQKVLYVAHIVSSHVSEYGSCVRIMCVRVRIMSDHVSEYGSCVSEYGSCDDPHSGSVYRYPRFMGSGSLVPDQTT